MKAVSVCVLLLTVVCSSIGVENLQEWSIQTKLGVDYTFTCNDTYQKTITVEAGDLVEWRRRGHSGNIMNDSHFVLTEMGGIDKFQLTIKAITDTMGGIYLCDVMYSNGTHKGTVVKGLNLGGHEYDDNLDKYEDNIIVGVIAGGSVLFLLVAVGLIDHFRVTDEKMQKRRGRQGETDDKIRRWETSGEVNNGADIYMTEDVKKPIDATANGDAQEVNTHL